MQKDFIYSCPIDKPKTKLIKNTGKINIDDNRGRLNENRIKKLIKSNNFSGSIEDKGLVGMLKALFIIIYIIVYKKLSYVIEK